MGRPTRKNIDKTKQKKTKQIKKQKSSPSKSEPEIDESSSRKNQDANLNSKQDCQFLKWLNNLTIKNSIQAKVSEVTEVLNQVRLFGMTSKADDSIRQKLRENCQRAGNKSINTFVIEAQNEIFDKQREYFKKINDLERSYNDVKAVLQDSNNFNEIQIDKVLDYIEKKRQQKKQDINVLDRLIQKGNAILGEKSIQSN